jgi:methionine aminopeptidase
MNTPVSSISQPDIVFPTSEFQLDSIADAALASSISSTALRSARNILRRTYDEPITQLEITNHLDAIMRAEGSDAELSFPSGIMTRDEFSRPYGLSNDDAEHIINPSQEPVVTIRVGARVNGQCVDIFRTFFFESVTQEIVDAYTTVLDTQLAVIDAIAPGVSIASLDSIVQSGLSSYIGLPNVTYSYYWGHGVADFAVVEPFLSNETAPMTLVEDQLFTIQIWLYHDDGWFVRVEDTVQVTSTGVNVLSDAPKALEDIYILPGTPKVEDNVTMDNYEYGMETTANVSLSDSANRTMVSVDYFDGIGWVEMQKLSPNNFSITYLLDYSYASFIRSILKINLSNETIYIVNELECDPGTEFVYEEIYDPPIHAVIEQVDSDDPYRWVFSKVGAEMLRINFYNVYPPPGDQFIVKDGQGNVVIEYKWDLGAPAITPWVPGNILFIDVTSTWKSEFGGINHFFFTVDMLWILDTDYTPPTSNATTTSSTTTTSTQTTFTTPTTTSTEAQLLMDSSLLLIGGLFSSGLVLVVLFIRRSKSSP